MQDYRKLQAFELADQLALEVYKITLLIPDDERFGLIAQLRRAAVSTASNIVEGCGRDGRNELLHFLSMAHGSAHEVAYQLSLAYRLRYFNDQQYNSIRNLAERTPRAIYGLMQKIKRSH